MRRVDVWSVEDEGGMEGSVWKGGVWDGQSEKNRANPMTESIK